MLRLSDAAAGWIPAFAGMTEKGNPATPLDSPTPSA